MAMSAILVSTASLNLPAYASVTSNLNVTANITANCTMSNTDLDFGDYDATGINSSSHLRATATISTTTCTSGANGVITMNGGRHFTFCMSSKCHRRMANEGETSFLDYNIYTNESYSWSNVWSDNTSATREIVQMMGAGVSQNTTIYGQIKKNQRNAVAGSYSDTIIITLNY